MIQKAFAPDLNLYNWFLPIVPEKKHFNPVMKYAVNNGSLFGDKTFPYIIPLVGFKKKRLLGDSVED